MTRTRTALTALTAAAVVTVGTLGLTAGSATAAPAKPGDGTAAKQAVEKRIDERLAQLARLHTRTDGAKGVTDGDKTTLDGIIDAETAGLTALRGQVDGATDGPTIAGYAKSMVEDYRVYAVVTPQVHLTLAADQMSSVITKLTDQVEPKLQAAIDEAKAAGKDTTAAEAADAELEADVTAAAHDVDGASATALALTPHGYPDNRPTIEATRTSLEDAHTQLVAARAAAHTVVDSLK